MESCPGLFPPTETPQTKTASITSESHMPPSSDISTMKDNNSPQPLSEGVAIVGMACRTAGDNNTPEELWGFLLEKKVGSGEVPRKRWEPWLQRDVRNEKEIGRTISKGYFIETLENFDASFFGISPKEAEQMDPHQRVALELSWEALEDAGIDPTSLGGTDTAVYMGVDSDDYSRLLLEDIPNIEAWMGIGTAAHGVPNRISYHLNLMGPSAAVDAACASSLVAIHLGYQAILNGESVVAIVGGVNVLLAPALTRVLGKAGALSPEGICRSFDDTANGYARGEGGAVLVLKKLSKAIKDGDNILCTLKGSAIAQDGKTNGIMAPNVKAQELVARQALSRAGIDPLSVGFIEAHATSTPLGDPTEISAISTVYGNGRPAGSPAYVGSIKPNIGHLEAAAGAISLVKAVLTVKKGLLAPQAHLNKLNSKIEWDNSGLEVVREIIQWPSQNGPRRAAVCSYGYGGTVSHAIIEEFKGQVTPVVQTSQAQLPVILTLSAGHEKRLRPQANDLTRWLSSRAGQDTNLDAIANTLSQHRAHKEFRVAFVVQSHNEAVSALSQYVSDSGSHPVASIQGRALGAASSIWVFSGHGAQWNSMGRELLQNDVFFTSVSSLDVIAQREASFSVVEALSQGDFDASERVQILTYVIQIGLSKLLHSKGVRPMAVIGHSVGEIAASVIAGCMTPDEGMLVVTRRAKLYSLVRDECLGGMALINMSFRKAQKIIGRQENLAVAVNSSPTSCVVSGTAVAIEQFVNEMTASGVRTFRVNTDIAFHSPMMKRLENPLRCQLAGSIYPQSPQLPIYSTSNVNPRTDVLRDIEYWVNNMKAPVHLHEAVTAAATDGYRVFVEISSHPIVLHSINEILVDCGLADAEFVTISTLKRDAPAIHSLQTAIARMHVNGVNIDFNFQCSNRSLWSQEVPRTQWVHQPYYKKVETYPLRKSTVHDVDKHTLLGERTVVAGINTVLYTTKLNEKSKPFPGNHPLHGTEIIPAAVYINTFHHATGANMLHDIQIKIPVCVTPDPQNIEIVSQKDVVFIASSAMSQPGSEGISVDQTWITHSSCHWTNLEMSNDITAQQLNIAMVKQRMGNMMPKSFATEYLSKIGVGGIAFPWQVMEHYGNTNEMIVKVDMDPSTENLAWDSHSWAPLLDAATSVASTIFFKDPKLRVVSRIGGVALIHKAPLPKTAYLYVESVADASDSVCHVSVLDDHGNTLAKINSMRFAEIETTPDITSKAMESLVHCIAWIPPKFSENPRQLENVVLVSSDKATLISYAQQLEPHTTRVFTFNSAQEVQDYSGADI